MFEFLNPFRRLQERRRVRLVVQKALEQRNEERAAEEREAARREAFMAHLQELTRIVEDKKKSQNDIY